MRKPNFDGAHRLRGARGSISTPDRQARHRRHLRRHAGPRSGSSRPSWCCCAPSSCTTCSCCCCRASASPTTRDAARAWSAATTPTRSPPASTCSSTTRSFNPFIAAGAHRHVHRRVQRRQFRPRAVGFVGGGYIGVVQHQRAADRCHADAAGHAALGRRMEEGGGARTI